MSADRSNAATDFVNRYWEAWRDEVIATVRGKVAALPELDLEAFYNEAWMILFGRLSADDRPENPRGFLVKVTTNKAIDELRKRQPARQAPPEVLALEVDRGADVTRLADDRQTLRHLKQGIDAFSPHQRRITYLAALGFTRREIAALLGVGEKSVHRAFEQDRSKNHTGITAKIKNLMRELE